MTHIYNHNQSTTEQAATQCGISVPRGNNYKLGGKYPDTANFVTTTNAPSQTDCDACATSWRKRVKENA